jgi:hypothetical protein
VSRCSGHRGLDKGRSLCRVVHHPHDHTCTKRLLFEFSLRMFVPSLSW